MGEKSNGKRVHWDTMKQYDNPLHSVNLIPSLRPIKSEQDTEPLNLDDRTKKANDERNEEYNKDIFYSSQRLMKEIPEVLFAISDEIFNSDLGMKEIFKKERWRPFGLFLIIMAAAVLLILLLDRA